MRRTARGCYVIAVVPKRRHTVEWAGRSTLLNRGLFTRDFLIEGIGNEVAWQRLDDAALDFLRNRLDALFASFGKLKTPTEPETEKELIWPLLEALGWSDMLVQQNLSAKRRDDVPDALLFPNAEAKQKAMPMSAWQRFQHGVCVSKQSAGIGRSTVPMPAKNRRTGSLRRKCSVISAASTT